MQQETKPALQRIAVRPDGVVRVRLNRQEIDACIDFSMQCAEHQQAIEFGQSDTAKRSISEIARDNIIGKLGEFAVKAFFEKNGIAIELDLEIYERGRWDTCDIAYRGWTFDIKCSKSRSRWLLIEWNKLQFRADAGEVPNYFLLTRLVNDAIVLNSTNIRPDILEVDLVGYVDARKLRDGNEGVASLKKGAPIPGTATYLVANSFGVEDRTMSRDWTVLLATLRSDAPFSLDSYEAPGIVRTDPALSTERKTLQCTPSSVATNSSTLPIARYSLLLSGDWVPGIDTLRAETERGVKLYLFVPTALKPIYDVLQGHAESRVFAVTKCVPNLAIADGEGVSLDHPEFVDLEQAAPDFNLEQYVIEHAPADTDIIVKASAGTGKTTVMIDRIIELFATDKTLKPRDLALITFTNMATTSKTGKLQKRLLTMLELTGSPRWRALAEGLSELRISTIDSFFKDLLASEGSTLGFGQSARLRGLDYEKQKLVLQIMNELYQKGCSSLFHDKNVSIDSVSRLSLALWEKLRSLGFYRESVFSANFGSADNNSSALNDLVSKIIPELERRYQDMKREQNVYALDDMKAELDALTATSTPHLHRTSLRYLFVDEFQDTDNSQIGSLAWLAHTMGAHLFVVGDVKQSIYRFRGAEESAFEVLQNTLATRGLRGALEFTLKKNYRTAPAIIRDLNSIFSYWATSTEKLLLWDADAVAQTSLGGRFQTVSVKPFPWSPAFSSQFVKTIRNLRTADQVRQLCVLVRDNWQVNKVADICQEAGLPCRAKRQGGFYVTKPVLDLEALLAALLYPNDPRRLWNLLTTPYAKSSPDPDRTATLAGSTEALVEYFTKLLGEALWLELIEKLRTKPFFAVLAGILERLDPVSRYGRLLQSSGTEKDVLRERIEHYQLNLEKVIAILYDHFSGEYPTLLEAYDFLHLKILTDRKEDELYPEIEPPTDGFLIEAMTVHKAKGLEFDAVLLPNTTRPFFKKCDKQEKKGGKVDSTATKHFEITVVPDAIDSHAPVQVGWKNDTKQNDHFDRHQADEEKARRRDEARLLYVAMTRAKSQLIVFVPEEPKPDTWSEFLHAHENRKGASS